MRWPEGDARCCCRAEIDAGEEKKDVVKKGTGQGFKRGVGQYNEVWLKGIAGKR